jgi:hypothetical protein
VGHGWRTKDQVHDPECETGMSATIIPIRPEVDRCVADVKMFQDLLHECSLQMSEDVDVLEETKKRYLEIQNNLRMAVFNLHRALGLE